MSRYTLMPSWLLSIPPPGTQVDVTSWSIVEPSIGIMSAYLPTRGPLLRVRIADVRSLSWFTRTKTSGSPHNTGSAGHQSNVQIPERPAPAATLSSKLRDVSVSDVEMAMSLSDVEAAPEKA